MSDVLSLELKAKNSPILNSLFIATLINVAEQENY